MWFCDAAAPAGQRPLFAKTQNPTDPEIPLFIEVLI